MSDVDALLLYSRVRRISFNGTRDTLDFISAIESRTRIRYTNYQRIFIAELSVQAIAQDWFMQSMQSIQPYIDTMIWIEFKGQFMRYFCPPATRDAFRWKYCISAEETDWLRITQGSSLDC